MILPVRIKVICDLKTIVTADTFLRVLFEYLLYNACPRSLRYTKVHEIQLKCVDIKVGINILQIRCVFVNYISIILLLVQEVL
jgi:hypothetical protein